MIRKSGLFLSLTFLSPLAVFCQIDSSLLPQLSHDHYIPEYTFDISKNPAAWNNVNPGLHAEFGSEDHLYFRTEVPAIEMNNTQWKATGWKGERLNTQVVIWSRDSLRQVRLTASDLKNENGKIIQHVLLNKICYVVGNYPYGSPEPQCSLPASNQLYLYPDRFENLSGENNRFDVPGKTVRSVWISLNIPEDAEPGNYQGTISVNSEKESKLLRVNIKVQNKILTRPQDWQYRLDLWQNPWVIADYYHIKPWSAEHLALLKTHLRLYADAGGKFITTYGVHSPWGGAEYAIEGGMIEWIKKSNGEWKFDYSIFDKYVELAMSVGIKKAITMYTALPSGEMFRFLDEKTGNYVYEQWPVNSEEYRKNWFAFLTDFRNHLQKKGWLDKTYIGINENELNQTLISIKVVKEHWKGWKITYAGDWHKELDTLLTDFCFKFGKEASSEEVKLRSERGQTTTYYVCCEPAKPNTFIFSPPVEARWMGWYSQAHGYNGFLRWAYDAWPEDPLRDARFGSWASGDCYLVYPGGNSCIRFEKLREGIVDYEKIFLLKKQAQSSNDPYVKNLINQLNSLLVIVDHEKNLSEENLMSQLDKGKQIINELSEKLK